MACEEKFQETETSLQIACRRLNTEGASDMRELEEGLRAALLADGATLLSALLNRRTLKVPGDEPRAGEKVHEQRPLRAESLSGPIVIKRRYYYEPPRGHSRALYPR